MSHIFHPEVLKPRKRLANVRWETGFNAVNVLQGHKLDPTSTDSKSPRMFKDFRSGPKPKKTSCFACLISLDVHHG